MFVFCLSSFFIFIGVELLYNVVFLLYNHVNQLYVYMHTLCLEPPSTQAIIPPLQVTELQAELPVPYRSSPLAVYFTHGSIFMLLLFSQFVPETKSFWVTPTLLYPCLVCYSVLAVFLLLCFPFIPTAPTLTKFLLTLPLRFFILASSCPMCPELWPSETWF